MAMVSMQGKGGTTPRRKETETCYYCGKPGHIARFCFKSKNNNKEKENANKAKDNDDYAFATKDGDHCKDALHLQRTLPTTLAQSTLTYNTTSFERSWRVEK